MKPSASFQQKYAAYQWRLHRNVLAYVFLLLCLMGIMGWAEHQGLSRNLIGPIFLFSTVMIYAFIGVAGRTSNADEYYVAGRRIPAFYNGMACRQRFISRYSAYLCGHFGGAGWIFGHPLGKLGWPDRPMAPEPQAPSQNPYPGL